MVVRQGAAICVCVVSDDTVDAGLLTACANLELKDAVEYWGVAKYDSGKRLRTGLVGQPRGGPSLGRLRRDGPELCGTGKRSHRC